MSSSRLVNELKRLISYEFSCSENVKQIIIINRLYADDNAYNLFLPHKMLNIMFKLLCIMLYSVRVRASHPISSISLKQLKVIGFKYRVILY